MACKYTYKGAEYTEEEFRKVLKSMPRPELQKYVPSATVPSAPFVTSTDAWVELGLKQAIRMAVEGGYDRIAWTTGNQQNGRYDLSKQVDSIGWKSSQDGRGSRGIANAKVVTISAPQGDYGLIVGPDGIVADTVDDGAFEEQAVGKRLDEVVGKEIADKIMSEDSGDLSGDGLRVGGSGMKGFYDKILPTVAKKVSKRLGGDGKVGQVNISETGQQQSISITPEMRAKVQQGVPLMQDAKGAVEFARGGEAIIRALENPDASTGIHELAHVARRFLFDRSIPQENRQGITDEHIATAEKWAGAKDGNWSREAEEKFARGFERYLRDGKAPNDSLKDVFQKFATWLRDIYLNLFTSPVKDMVSPEMRKVYDALVTRAPINEQRQAEQVPERGGQGTKAATPAAQTPSPAPVAEGSGAAQGAPQIETLSEPKTLHRGQDGKRTADGERINEHKGVNGLFASESLEAAQKYGRKTGAKSIELPAGTTVETIEINGDLDEAFRKREVDAINASKADVVKLVTVDGDRSGKQVQYVLKNKDLWPPRREKIEDPPVIPPTEPPVREITDESWRQRNTHGSAKWLKERAPQIYKALNKNARRDIEYDVLPNKVSLEAARNIVGYLGIENAIDAAFDPANGLPMAVRTMIMGVSVTELERMGELDRATALWADAMDYGTDIGQGAQAFNAIKGMYSPAIVLNEAQRVVKNALDRVPAEARARAEHVYNTLTDTQRQVVEQILLKQSIQDRINKRAANPPYSAGGSSISFGKEVRQALETAKRKSVTRKAAEQAFKELGSMMNSGVPPQMVTIAVYLIERGARSFAEVAKVVTKRLGKKALPYLKAAYAEANKQLGINDEFVTTPEQIDEYIAKQNTDLEVKRFERAIKAGRDAEAAKAIAALQQVARDMGVWGAYRDQAAERLKRMAEKTIADGRLENPPVAEFTQGLIRNMVSQMREQAEAMGKEESEVKRPSDIKIIGEAYKNPEKYKEVWQKTQNEFRAKLNAAKARLAKAETPEAKEEAKRAIEREHDKLEKLDAYYGDLMPKPFSDALLGRAIRDGLKAENIKINEIIRQHYSIPEAAKRTLQQKLVQEAGLTEEQGTELADQIGREFNRMMDERKAAAQDQFIKRKTTKRTRKERRIEDEAILLTNTGALSKEEFLQKYAEIMDWPRLTKEDADDLVRLSNRVQEAPEGRPRNEAISDLLGKMADLKGVSKWDIGTAVWYSHLLSGVSTQGVNFVANTARLMAEGAAATMRNPSDVRGLIGAITYGFARGVQEFRSTLVTGYSPVRGKVEAAALLERHKFKGPLRILNNHKYVQRLMRAVDTLFYEPLREMRAYQVAATEARSTYPSDSIRKKALELMNRDDQSINQAQQQAQAEYEEEMKRISSSDLSASERRKAEGKADRDRKRRAFELVELGRPQDMLERSANFALASTYNDPPKGTIGAFARGMNNISREVPPLRAVIPFVNVVANVLTDALNYTPIGAARAMAGGSVIGAVAQKMGSDRIMQDFEKMSPAERADVRADMLAKFEIATIVFTALLLATEPGDDDEPLIEVTGSGFGSYGKNEVLRKSGWTPKSIRIGDRWYSYEYTPLTLLLSAVGNYRDSQKYRKDDSDKSEMERWHAAVSRTVPSILDMSFLSSSEKLLSGLANPEGDNKIEDLIASSVKSAKRLVIPAIYDEAARGIEAAYNSPLKDVRRSIFGNFLKDIPGARDNYPVRYDALGDPVMPDWRPFRRFQSPADESDPVVNLIIDKQFQLRLPPVTTPIYDPDLEKDREMTPQEREIYYQVRGRAIREGIEDKFNELEEMTPNEFAKAMVQIQKEATTMAKKEVMGF